MFAKYLLLILPALFLFSCGQEEGEKRSFTLPSLDEITILLQEEELLIYAYRDTLWEWDSMVMDRPYFLSKKRGVEMGFFRLLDQLSNPGGFMLPAMRSYRVADSLAWNFNSLPFELGMPSSNVVYHDSIMLTWPEDPSVMRWKIEWRNQYDEITDSSFTNVNRILISLKEDKEKALYIRHPISREGSGVFMLTQMEDSEKKIHEQALINLNSQSLLHILAMAAYFEEKGLYTDALSCYVRRWDQFPERRESKLRLANFMYRNVFPPLY
jgi:hypothetical protein